MTIEERFWNHVEAIPEGSGCWEWTGATVKDGYGRVELSHLGKRIRAVMAHRLSWGIHMGPIPPGMSVLHHCDNPPCVNPAHLFLGTQADNIRDMILKGRYRPKARAEVCAKGHADFVMYVERDAAHRRCRTCIRERTRLRDKRRRAA